jgi:DNA-binding transcriptional LysR family regulator
MESIAFEQTLDEDYVGLSSGASLLALMTDAAFEAGRPLKLRIQVSAFDGICRMIEAGLGIGILPRAAVRPELVVTRLRIVRLTDRWATRTLWIGANDSAMSSPDVARLFTFLSDSTPD